jgi:hypothetical protein
VPADDFEAVFVTEAGVEHRVPWRRLPDVVGGLGRPRRVGGRPAWVAVHWVRAGSVALGARFKEAAGCNRGVEQTAPPGDRRPPGRIPEITHRSSSFGLNALCGR